MFLLYFLLIVLWLLVGTFIVSQVIIPMFTDYRFFWIFTYFKVRKKYKNKLNEVDIKSIEKELKDSICRRK